MNHNFDAIHKFQERNIKTWLAEMDAIYNSFEYDDPPPDNEDFSSKEIRAAYHGRFEYLANRVYNLCVAYFESLHLPLYVTRFEKKISPFLESNNLMRCYPTLAERRSALTHEFELFLNSFSEFASTDEKYNTGLTILENILESTALVLRKNNKIPTGEVDVYNAVKILCEAAFPKAKFPTESFQKTAKCYKPDILIPSLNCAIEYKYAENTVRLTQTIDEILADVKGYDDNSVYNLFYAVFYVKPGHITKTRFEEIWKEKGFPENWKAILVEGF